MTAWVQFERWWRFPDLIVTLEERALQRVKGELPAGAGEPLAYALAEMELQDLSRLFLPDRERLRLTCQAWDMFSALEPPLYQSAQRWEYGVLRSSFNAPDQAEYDRWGSYYPWEAPISESMILANGQIVSQWPPAFGRFKTEAFRIKGPRDCCKYVFATQPTSPWVREIHEKYKDKGGRAHDRKERSTPSIHLKRYQKKKLHSAEEMRGSVRRLKMDPYL